jgi:hypothetical protein
MISNTKELLGSNPPKDQVVGKGAEGSIGTQPEEERMQMHGVMESSNQLEV